MNNIHPYTHTHTRTHIHYAFPLFNVLLLHLFLGNVLIIITRTDVARRSSFSFIIKILSFSPSKTAAAEGEEEEILFLEMGVFECKEKIIKYAHKEINK